MPNHNIYLIIHMTVIHDFVKGVLLIVRCVEQLCIVTDSLPLLMLRKQWGFLPRPITIGLVNWPLKLKHIWLVAGCYATLKMIHYRNTIYIHVHTHTYIHTYIHMYIIIYMYAYIHTYIHLYMHSLTA